MKWWGDLPSFIEEKKGRRRNKTKHFLLSKISLSWISDTRAPLPKNIYSHPSLYSLFLRFLPPPLFPPIFTRNSKLFPFTGDNPSLASCTQSFYSLPLPLWHIIRQRTAVGLRTVWGIPIGGGNLQNAGRWMHCLLLVVSFIFACG